MRVEDTGILRANGVGNALLKFEKLGTGGDKGRLKAGDFLGKLLGFDLARRDILVVQPMNDCLPMGDSGRDGDSGKSFSCFGITPLSLTPASRSSKR